MNGDISQALRGRDEVGLREALVLDTGERLGDALQDWQRAALADADTAALTWIEWPRACGKTTIAAAWSLGRLLCGAPGQRGYVVAADADQAGILLDLLRGLARRSGLEGLVTFTTNEARVEAADSMLHVQEAHGPSIWGLLPTFVVLDEIAEWLPGAQRLSDATLTATSKRNATVLVITKAGCLPSWQYDLREAVRKDPTCRFHRREETAPWTPAEFLDRMASLLHPATYDRYLRNTWSAGGDAALSAEQVAGVFDDRTATEAPAKGRRYAIGVDLGVAEDRTACAVVHHEGEGFGVDVLAVWQGSREAPVDLAAVRQWIRDTSARFGRAPVRLDAWQSLLMAQELEAEGVSVEALQITAQSRARLFGELLLAVRQGRLKCYEHTGLRDELAGLRVQARPGGFTVNHCTHTHDDCACAVGLGMLLLGEAAQPHLLGPRSPASSPRLLSGRGSWESGAAGLRGMGFSGDERRRWERGPTPTAIEGMD